MAWKEQIESGEATSQLPMQSNFIEWKRLWILWLKQLNNQERMMLAISEWVQCSLQDMQLFPLQHGKGTQTTNCIRLNKFKYPLHINHAHSRKQTFVFFPCMKVRCYRHEGWSLIRLARILPWLLLSSIPFACTDAPMLWLPMFHQQNVGTESETNLSLK